MTAKEMFEKLRYKQDETFDKELISYTSIQQFCGERHFGITFNTRFKHFHLWHFGYDEKGRCDNGMNIAVDIQMLKAINKQVEELGWLGSDKE